MIAGSIWFRNDLVYSKKMLGDQLGAEFRAEFEVTLLRLAPLAFMI